MKKPIELPNNSLLIEQHHLRSGPLISQDSNVTFKTGIIFTSFEDKDTGEVIQATENDFDPNKIIGETIVNRDVPGLAGEFIILGGYFCKRDGNGGVKNSQIFGLAREGIFGVSENVIVGDKWRMEDITEKKASIEFLNERSKGVDGWTFLVTYKPSRGLYPFSGKPMDLMVEETLVCPSISIESISYTDGFKKGFRTVTIKIDVENGPAGRFEWEFGDGTPPVTTIIPEITHDYPCTFEEQKFTVTVTSNGPRDCTDKTTGLVLIAPKPHPALSKVEEIGEREDMDDGKKVKIRFQASLVDPQNPHDSYTWNFGDNTGDVNSGRELISEHVYDKPKAPKNFIVTVDGNGPDTCHSQVNSKVLIAPPLPACPVIGQVKQVDMSNLSDTRTQYKLKVEYTGAQAPTKYIWSWIDEDREYVIETNGPEATVVLERTSQHNRPVIIKLNTFGPNECTGESNICVNVPGLVEETCPWYMKAFPYFLALMTSLVFCAVIVCWLGENKGQVADSEGARDHMYFWITVVSFIWIIAGFIWFVLGRKSKCGPNLCVILAIAWTAFFASAGFTALTRACFDSFLPLFFIMLFLAIITRIYYGRTCKNKFTLTQELIFLAIGVLGFVLGFVAHAQPSLACC